MLQIDTGLMIGNQVSCGHRAILHACTIEDRVLVGMNAIVMDGAEVGSGSIIGAGALVTKGTRIPSGSLVLGSPAKIVRSLTAAEQKGIEELAAKYVSVGKYYWGRSQIQNSEFRSQKSSEVNDHRPFN